MNVSTIVICCLGLATVQAASTNTGVDPYALIDEATDLLAIVRDAVVQAINSAHGRLDGYYDRFEIYSSDLKTEAEVIMGYEGQKIDGQVVAIEELAQSTGADVSVCLGNYREDVANLTRFLTDDITVCMSDILAEAAEIIVEYKYLIDIRINRVDALEFELGLCDPTSDSCIEPIYERIQLERQYGAESVDMQTITVNNLLNQMRVLVQDCSNLNVSVFVNNVNAILQQISECADAIIK